MLQHLQTMLTAASIYPVPDATAEKTTTYLYTVIGIGAAVLLEGLSGWNCPDWRRFAAYLGLAMITAAVHVSAPRLTATFSLAFVLVLVSVFDLTYSESLMVVSAAGFVQCLRKGPLKSYLPEMVFNIAVLMVCLAACSVVAHSSAVTTSRSNLAFRFSVATCLFFMLNTALVSGLIAIARGEPLRRVSKFWLTANLPIYLFGSIIAGLFVTSVRLA
jgi:hypothetical protein